MIFKVQVSYKNEMKQLIKKCLPSFVIKALLKMINQWELFKLAVNDYTRFRRYSFGINQLSDKDQFCALITKRYHSIEKGLSYREIRLGFGKDVINSLLELLETYKIHGYDLDEACIVNAISTLNEYIMYHEASSYDVSNIKSRVNGISSSIKAGFGGALEIRKKDIMDSINENFEIFANSRYSVREFTNEKVDISLIENAIEIAKKTPSACNRQAWKVKVIKGKKEKEVLLKNQNGNKGFGDKIDTFILITCNISSFAAPRERNQVYIDGGMFSMSLLYGLHYQGLATCSLSASLTNNQERNIRASLNIKDSEDFILFIGVGHYMDEFKVPKSLRKNVKEYYDVI